MTMYEKNSPSEMIEKDLLKEIEIANTLLTQHYKKIMVEDKNLTRKLVSFQANKDKPIYRWYKYKEAFSADLIEYLCNLYSISNGKVLDPFAGAGTALFSVANMGMDADGIELLPIGQKIIETRKIVYEGISENSLMILENWINDKPWNESGKKREIEIYRITDGAYPQKTLNKIQSFLGKIEEEVDEVKALLLFSLLCILESVSYTRKDGQYLRWDHRSGRRSGKTTFNKGVILDFDEAITKKLVEIVSDIRAIYKDKNLFPISLNKRSGKIKLMQGSCLDILPSLKKDTYKAIITSPPYANRYDYTRTYALELAVLGVKSEELIKLRQEMISCTVENREKQLIELNKNWHTSIEICDNLPALQSLLKYLKFKKDNKELNNAGIYRMIKGYFYEMACVIQDSYNILESGGVFIMVNDNVKYAGISIPVDLILSAIAESIGFEIESIRILPQKKGNSSQQMGEHGREVLRKCVYVWRKK